MGLTAPQIDAHIAHWKAALRASYRSYRDKWPSRLFHHAPLENAVAILQSGQLLSRRDTRALGIRDVAAQAVVNSTSTAHRFCRLYFRPRTPTQFYIEGVRKNHECWNGELGAHAPILYMFVFSAQTVLALPDTNFSNGNMQSPYTTYGPTLEDFQQLDFTKIYHEGGIAGDHSIITARCAEVLAPSPLPLEGHLQFILCRSRAERQTLLHQLGDAADDWADLIRVSDDMQVFQREFCYVEEVSIATRGVVFRLHPRVAYAPILVQVEATRVSTGRVAASFGPAELNADPGQDFTHWRVSGARCALGSRAILPLRRRCRSHPSRSKCRCHVLRVVNQLNLFN
jgi:hypothetical protein